jgi:hypothetical protein
MVRLTGSFWLGYITGLLVASLVLFGFHYHVI